MSEPIRDFRDLILWQRAMDYVTEVYVLTKRFPADEKFALSIQLRRAAVSVPSNIAEGHARQGREFKQFLSIARGSLAESECQILLALRLGYVEAAEAETALSLAKEIRRMAVSLARKLVADP